MKISVCFFGVLAEVTQTNFKHYNNVESLNDLRLRIDDDFPGIRNYEYRILINSEIQAKDYMLTDGDEVTLVPPLTGNRDNVSIMPGN